MNAVSFTRIGTILKASKTKIAAVLLLVVLGIVLFPGMKLNAAEELSGPCGDNVTWTEGSGDPVELKAENGKYTMPKPSDSFDYNSDTVTIKEFFKNAEYEITFKNYDGTVLEKKKVPEGEIPEYTGTIVPSKPSSGGYSYEFAGWDTAPVAVTGPATYTATYTRKEIEYEITFKNYDGTVLEKKKVPEGEIPEYTGTIVPSKPSTGGYSYEFAGWDTAPVAVTGPATYTATYTKKENEYEITFKNYDGTVLEKKKVPYGDVPSYTGTIVPSKPSSGGYSYEFAGWDTAPVAVTGPATYTATYTRKEIEYEITFKNYDGTVLEKKNVPYGDVPSYTGTIVPSKPSSGGYSFEFAGWDTAPVAVTGPATYTAMYSRKENEYKVTFVDDDGAEICSDKVKYHEVPVFNGNNPVRKETDTHTFTFVGWSDGKTTYTLDQGLPQIESDTTFSPVFDPVVKPVYTVGEVKGDGQNSDIVIDVHRNVDDENCITYFLGAAIDGTEMKVNDQYTATKGSTIITIKKDYASTLSAGEHEVTVNFNDGSITAKVTIAAKANTNTNLPATGEVTGPVTYIGLTLIAAASVCGAGVMLLKKRKEA